MFHPNFIHYYVNANLHGGAKKLHVSSPNFFTYKLKADHRKLDHQSSIFSLARVVKISNPIILSDYMIANLRKITFDL